MALALASLASFDAACSSSDGSNGASDPASGLATSANGNSADGGLVADAAPIGPDGAPLTQDQLDACSNLAYQANDQVEETTGGNDYPSPLYACTTDADCVVVDNSTKCASGCGAVIAASQVAGYQAAIASVNGGICAGATGCPGFEGTCSGDFGAACYSNQCTFGFPAAWQSFTLESDTGGSGSTLPATCSGTNCTLWTLTPDSKVTVKSGAANVRTATLSTADFATVDGILRSQQFRIEATSGVTCAQYSGSAHVSESVQRARVDVGGDVTSCVAGMIVEDGGATPVPNDYLNLYNVLKGY